MSLIKTNELCAHPTNPNIPSPNRIPRSRSRTLSLCFSRGASPRRGRENPVLDYRQGSPIVGVVESLYGISDIPEELRRVELDVFADSQDEVIAGNRPAIDLHYFTDEKLRVPHFLNGSLLEIADDLLLGHVVAAQDNVAVETDNHVSLEMSVNAVFKLHGTRSLLRSIGNSLLVITMLMGVILIVWNHCGPRRSVHVSDSTNPVLRAGVGR